MSAAAGTSSAGLGASGDGVATPDVRLEGVSKRFRDTVAVDGIDLEISHGEFFSLLGPSGCGKSTTLAMIGGFEEPSEGSVYLGGNAMRRVPSYRRDVNTVFQSYALFPHLDVAANVGFGLRRRKLARDAIGRRVGEALELVGLAGLEKRRPAQLSGGQQQRVALARALVNEPRVLLLDEPLGALDLKLRKQMQVELKRIQREVGVTFLYVTHDQEEALAMSDRLAVMNLGKIEQIGVPEEVYDRPATEFVAAFLGASNLLPGEIRGSDGVLTTIALDDAGEVRVPAERVPRGAVRVKVGVRPEKLQPVRAGDGDAARGERDRRPRPHEHVSRAGPPARHRRSGGHVSDRLRPERRRVDAGRRGDRAPALAARAHLRRQRRRGRPREGDTHDRVRARERDGSRTPARPDRGASHARPAAAARRRRRRRRRPVGPPGRLRRRRERRRLDRDRRGEGERRRRLVDRGGRSRSSRGRSTSRAGRSTSTPTTASTRRCSSSRSRAGSRSTTRRSSRTTRRSTPRSRPRSRRARASATTSS